MQLEEFVIKAILLMNRFALHWPPGPPILGGESQLRVGPPQDWEFRGASAKLLNLFKTCVYTVALQRGENLSSRLGFRTYRE